MFSTVSPDPFSNLFSVFDLLFQIFSFDLIFLIFSVRCGEKQTGRMKNSHQRLQPYSYLNKWKKK